MSFVWEEKKLGEVISLEYGKPLPPSERNPRGKYAVYGANGIKDRSDKFYSNRRSIIVGRKGSAGEITLTECKFWPLDVTYFVTFDETKYDLQFLFYLLSLQDLTKLAKGVKPGINRNEVYSKLVRVPPLPEQQRIVAILDEAFAGLATAAANAEKNFENARELFKAAVVSDIFGDADERCWDSATVSELALSKKGSIRTGPFGSQLLHGEFVDDGVAVLGIDNAVANEFRWGKKRFITPEKFAQLSRYRVRPGDVLITIMGTCGRCAIVPDDIPVAINTKHLCCISLDQTHCLPKFLHAYFLYHPVAREFLAKEAKGSIMDGLNMGIIQRLPVRFPPVAEQQHVIEKMELLSEETQRLEANYQNMAQVIANLKQSILQKAFSGALTSPPSQATKEAAE